jgi:hypothetical protein
VSTGFQVENRSLGAMFSCSAWGEMVSAIALSPCCLARLQRLTGLDQRRHLGRHRHLLSPVYDLLVGSLLRDVFPVCYEPRPARQRLEVVGVAVSVAAPARSPPRHTRVTLQFNRTS